MSEPNWTDDLEAFPLVAIYCEQCHGEIVSRREQCLLAGADFYGQRRDRVRAFIPLQKAWHQYHEHGNPSELFALLQPGSGLLPSERRRLRRDLDKAGSIGSVFWKRRKRAAQLGGAPGLQAEMDVQALYPRGIPRRLSVLQVVDAHPDARAIWQARIRKETARIERAYANHRKRMSRPEYNYDVRDIINKALDDLQRDINETRQDQAP